MLRFQNKPDVVFSEFLKRSLEECIDDIGEDLEYSLDDFSNRHFEDEIIKSFGGGKEGLTLIRRELEKLLAAQTSEDLYMPTDRHFKLLDRILSTEVDCYNDAVKEMDEEAFKKYVLKDEHGNPVKELDFDFILAHFFWDTDYDLTPEHAKFLLSKEGSDARERGDFMKVGLLSSMNAPVDGEDLLLEKVELTPSTWGEVMEIPWNDLDKLGDYDEDSEEE